MPPERAIPLLPGYRSGCISNLICANRYEERGEGLLILIKGEGGCCYFFQRGPNSFEFYIYDVFRIPQEKEIADNAIKTADALEELISGDITWRNAF